MLNSLLIPSAMLVLMLILKIFPETDIGKFLKNPLVDTPAAWLLKASPWRVAAIAVTLVGVAALAQAVPIEMAFLAMGDVTAYLELLAAILALTAATRWKALRQSAARLLANASATLNSGTRRLGSLSAREARSRPRRRSPRRTQSEDDHGAAGGVFFGTSPATA